MTETEIAKSLAGHSERNRVLGESLSAKGMDLTKQVPADVHFWAWSQRDAAVLGRALFRKGFLVKLLAPSPSPEDSDRWSVEAGALVVPSEILGDKFTEEMIRLAGECEARYDGWGVSA